MSKVIDSRKYRNDARKLNKIGLEERFNQHLRLRNDEIEVLFKDEIPRKGLSNIQ